MIRSIGIAAMCGLFIGQAATAQTNSPFGGFKHDRTAPIEITSNSLEVHQAQSKAVFSGDVIAGQGTLRLSADTVQVFYEENRSDDSGTGAIKSMLADGNVFISNGNETAQGQHAEYNVDQGNIVMTGAVILTQGANAISGNRLVIDLNSGVGRIEGRVKTVFVPKKSGQSSPGNSN